MHVVFEGILANIWCICTAKRMLERRGIQTLSSFVIFDWSYIPEFKASFLLFWLDFHLLKSIGSPLDHYLMAK